MADQLAEHWVPRNAELRRALIRAAVCLPVAGLVAVCASGWAAISVLSFGLVVAAVALIEEFAERRGLRRDPTSDRWVVVFLTAVGVFGGVGAVLEGAYLRSSLSEGPLAATQAALGALTGSDCYQVAFGAIAGLVLSAASESRLRGGIGKGSTHTANFLIGGVFVVVPLTAAVGLAQERGFWPDVLITFTLWASLGTVAWSFLVLAAFAALTWVWSRVDALDKRVARRRRERDTSHTNPCS
ncbi:hypothetical protein OAX78_00930 [Planctomycetota bacterium]|nr:hypothetical protein [Planctomycetota bacterium]